MWYFQVLLKIVVDVFMIHKSWNHKFVPMVNLGAFEIGYLQLENEAKSWQAVRCIVTSCIQFFAVHCVQVPCTCTTARWSATYRSTWSWPAVSVYSRTSAAWCSASRTARRSETRRTPRATPSTASSAASSSPGLLQVEIFAWLQAFCCGSGGWRHDAFARHDILQAFFSAVLQLYLHVLLQDVLLQKSP